MSAALLYLRRLWCRLVLGSHDWHPSDMGRGPLRCVSCGVTCRNWPKGQWP